MTYLCDSLFILLPTFQAAPNPNWVCVLSKPFTFNTDSYKNIKKNFIFHCFTPCIIF